jgi:transcriptional regulator with XRE-family HTH domain/tetratricopeptide (TPR) repeat protein
MNVDPSNGHEIGPATWEPLAVREMLAMRDIAAIYELLQHQGVSQRRIAALTGQSQSEVSEILSAQRQVMAYDVLVRIADGLSIPRPYMGLGYDPTTNELIHGNLARPDHPADEREEVRQLLSHAAAVTIDAAVVNVPGWWQPVERTLTPVPQRIGDSDMAQLEAITGSLRATDYQYGGGACRDAVMGQVRWAQRFLRAEYSEGIGCRLHLALGDLHNLAGWTSLDVGLYSEARSHFARALEQAKYAGDASLVANVLYRMGRLHLHRGLCKEALKFFQLGQIAAQESGCELTVAMLCANEAWTYALLGDSVQALKSLGRAEDEFARAEPNQAPAWVRFFGTADLNAIIGVVHLSLPEPTSRRCATATTSLERGLAIRGPDMTRSKAFELTALATSHLVEGDLDQGAAVGQQAVDLAEQLRSVRVVDRLAPLEEAARLRCHHSDVRELAERIATLRSG